MAAHYTYFDHVTSDPNVQKFSMAVILGIVLCLIGLAFRSRIKTAKGIQDSIVPSEKLSPFSVFDLFMEVLVNFHDSVLGPENRRYVPFIASVFIFIFLANLIGLVPGVPAATTTVWVNVGMAIVVFCYFNYQGIRENGVVGYLKHFAGPFWWLAWFIFPLEIFSTCLRILTLNLRLYWNITADHTVLGLMTELTGWVVPALFYALGTFVCLMQAFVFTILTMVYILLATQHDEEHAH